MNFVEFSHVRLSAIASVVPAEEMRLVDEAAYYGGDLRKIDRIRKMAGIDRRRIAPEGVTFSDLSIQAAETLFKENNVDRNGVDALICVSQSPDYPVPGTAFILHKALGLPPACAAFDINLGCSGYIYGLWMASSLIESRAGRRVLLLVGEVYHRYINPANRITAPLFGDASTASLLEYADDAAPLSFSMGSDGNGYEAIIRPGGGARIPHLPGSPDDADYLATVPDADGNPWTVGGYGNLWMDGMAVFAFTMTVVNDHILAHLAHKNITPKNLDKLILHQANKQIVQNLALSCEFTPEQAPWETMSKYGNQAGASIPVTICDQLKSACDAGDRLRLMLCGFGIGLSWGSCLGDFTGLHCTGVHDFVPQTSPPGRAEQIAYWHKKFEGEGNG
ncbi:MAG: ketoacyl-ACP synthase III [Desulfovibrio sp.]|jgi:3-oxoacyl-[acyl-carrier-protein] synthase-3|nr:ketoacyl-ACP synthase III [Desulfovibrio sp.]